MVRTLVVALIAMWALGILTFQMIGGLGHLLLVGALILMFTDFVKGRKSLESTTSQRKRTDTATTSRHT